MDHYRSLCDATALSSNLVSVRGWYYPVRRGAVTPLKGTTSKFSTEKMRYAIGENGRILLLPPTAVFIGGVRI
ncbi:hypothetical protein R1flu_009214 [Riccia fluitans]|uniref:Uncharacterized protein n=1 Tax=Riccia fluitans TaxID=41844 RepID=A0ABD1Z5K9_9MARC